MICHLSPLLLPGTLSAWGLVEGRLNKRPYTLHPIPYTLHPIDSFCVTMKRPLTLGFTLGFTLGHFRPWLVVEGSRRINGVLEGSTPLVENCIVGKCKKTVTTSPLRKSCLYIYIYIYSINKALIISLLLQVRSKMSKPHRQKLLESFTPRVKN